MSSELLRIAMDENVSRFKSHQFVCRDNNVSPLEETIKEHDDEKKADSFLAKQRQRILNLARTYDTYEEILVDFMKIERQPDREENLDSILQKIQQIDNDEKNVNNDDNEGKIRRVVGAGTIEREIRESLGMTDDETGDGSKKKDGQDDDDDLMLVDDGLGRTGGANLICPITRTLLENPVKNVKCGHTYSKAAIHQHLNHTTKCPVAGCSNGNMSKYDLKDDLELTQHVRRQRRRQDAQREQEQLSQALDIDEEDDDDDGNDDNNKNEVGDGAYDDDSSSDDDDDGDSTRAVTQA